MKKRHRVLVVDAHPVVRLGISSCLASSETLQVVGEAGKASEALQMAVKLKPDIVLMDFDLPGTDGLAATGQMTNNVPGLKVLIYCMRSDARFIQRAKESGACGYILKTASGGELIEALENAAAGGTRWPLSQSIHEVVTRGTAEPFDLALLTNREREILCELASGARSKEIASHFQLSTRTVETHRRNLMAKLHIHTVAGLTKFAIRRGLIDLAPQSKGTSQA